MLGIGRGKLVWKLYVIGSLQVVLLGAAVVGVGYLLVHLHGLPPPPIRAHGPEVPDLPVSRRFRPPGPPSPLMLVPPLLTFLLSGLVIVGIGSFLTARWIVRPLEALSRAARALGAGDLTARSDLMRNDELGEVGRSFDEMAGRIQKLMREERELLANVSHELRTPLARIRVALEIASEANPEAGRLSLREINTDLTEVEGLIDDIITTTRLRIDGTENGQPQHSAMALHRQDITPAALCKKASELFLKRHPLRMLATFADESLLPIRADPVLIRRAIDNLLENADKYSPDPDAPVVLRAEATGSEVIFEVRDMGAGIANEDLPHIFQPFFRSERSRSRVYGGVGLGLTLAKRIVEAHGGSIGVTSTAGYGTIVRIALPIRASLRTTDCTLGD
jgi:two-component system OmpR family sensor kinase